MRGESGEREGEGELLEGNVEIEEREDEAKGERRHTLYSDKMLLTSRSTPGRLWWMLSMRWVVGPPYGSDIVSSQKKKKKNKKRGNIKIRGGGEGAKEGAGRVRRERGRETEKERERERGKREIEREGEILLGSLQRLL